MAIMCQLDFLYKILEFAVTISELYNMRDCLSSAWFDSLVSLLPWTEVTIRLGTKRRKAI